MKGGVKILIVSACLFVAAIIVLLASIPLELSGCRSADDTDKTPGFEAEMYLHTQEADTYLYGALTDADKLPVLAVGKEYILTVRKYPQKSPFYEVVPCSNIKLIYDSDKLEITASQIENDNRFIVRGLTECRDEVIEIHHLYYGDTEFIPCSITVNFS